MILRLLLALGLSYCSGVFAQAAPPAGTWKLTLRTEQRPIIVLLALSQTDGKWVGDYIDATARFNQEPKILDLLVDKEHVKFRMVSAGQQMFSFDGTVNKEGTKITGSIESGGGLLLTELKSSALKKLTDAFEIEKEAFAQTDDAQMALETSIVVLGQAAVKKMPVDEARAMVDRVVKLSAGYGPRWEKTTALRYATVLVNQEG
ncbi:MAG: hypothetical protein ACRCZF_05835, partial [Gemmataceae bacterium]